MIFRIKCISQLKVEVQSVFVWVFEAVQMLRPMLRTGQFESVKKSLDYIFHYRMRAFLLLVNLQQHLVQLVQRGRGGLILQVWH